MLPPNSYFISLSNNLTDLQEGANKEQNVTDSILAFHSATIGSPGCGPRRDPPHSYLNTLFTVFLHPRCLLYHLCYLTPFSLLDPAQMPTSW